MRKPLYFILLIILIYSHSASAINRKGRMGIGMSNQLAGDLAAISLKIQNSPSMAMGLLVGLDTDDTSGGAGAGVKLYQLIFDEPQLNFYASVLGALVNEKTAGEGSSGFQFDFTLGTEFSFAGLQSLGFSFEFGVSLNKINDFKIQTVGHNFLVAGLHFYL